MAVVEVVRPSPDEQVHLPDHFFLTLRVRMLPVRYLSCLTHERGLRPAGGEEECDILLP